MLTEKQDARVHVYPGSDADVHLGGFENMKIWMMDDDGGSCFCKTCGVGLLHVGVSGAMDGNGKIPAAKEKLGHDVRVYAVNVRALRGVDWDKLKPNKQDNRGKDPQFIAD